MRATGIFLISRQHDYARQRLICLRLFLLTVICIAGAGKSFSQGYLSKRITVLAQHKPLGVVLQNIAEGAGFSFSYSSDIIPGDSIISLSVNNRPVREVLDGFFRGNIEYRESGSYVILRYAPFRLNMLPEEVDQSKKMFQISGYVKDERTGARISNASVYDKINLRSALTDEYGFFHIKVRTPDPGLALTVSKELYRDTTIMILPTVKVADSTYTENNYASDKSADLERTALGRMFISSKQKIQSLNLDGFFANSPFQASLIPGLSTHGTMSSQVVNKLSLNAIGGYTAGVNGLELAGVFNINKKEVRYVQLAGVFNGAGKSVEGLQAAGVYNVVLDGVSGVQAAGISNELKGQIDGVQLAGIYNRVRQGMRGVQVAGISNLVQKDMAGVQISGILNGVNQSSKGVQVSLINLTRRSHKGVQLGLINYAKNLKGFQLGLINVADSSSGFGFGLINLVMRDAYVKLAANSNEIQRFNLALKTGTLKFYTILQAGASGDDNAKLYSYGFGMGRQVPVSGRFYLNPEFTHLQVYQGTWDYTNQLERLSLSLHYKPARFISVFAGPAFNAFYSNQRSAVHGYGFLEADIRHFDIGKADLKGWLGWSAGISIL